MVIILGVPIFRIFTVHKINAMKLLFALVTFRNMLSPYCDKLVTFILQKYDQISFA